MHQACSSGPKFFVFILLYRVLSVTYEGMNFKALKMPKYPVVLIHSARFPANVIVREGENLIRTIEFMHSKQLLHMDIKGANIFLDHTGKWLLGDFGSSCPFGEVITSSTTSFCKENVIGSNGRPEFDWFMLLVTLIIETLTDKHTFRLHLYDDDRDKFVSELKLRGLVLGIANEELRTMLFGIINKMGGYFVL